MGISPPPLYSTEGGYRERAPFERALPWPVAPKSWPARLGVEYVAAVLSEPIEGLAPAADRAPGAPGVD